MLKILFVGKGVSNNGAINIAKEFSINYDYVDVRSDVNENYDIIIKGPGISYEERIIRKFQMLNKMVITDIEFTYWFLNRYYIGITGSNGKTTTTLLINELLNTKYKSIACGNIGYSIGEAFLKNRDCSHFICELSSFELKGTIFFTPKIAVITNINCCHLDYHKTFKDYIESKKKLIVNQKSTDYLIYNKDCVNTLKMIQNSKAIKLSFSLFDETANCYVKNNIIYLNNKKIISVDELSEKNINTIGNYLCAILVADIVGVDKVDINKTLIKFKKLRYRFEYITNNIINDAKSTNVYSTISAINSIDKPIILICGGLYRNYELNKLDRCLTNIKLVISYGETNELLKQYFSNKKIKCIKTKKLEEAVNEALKYLTSSDVLLYSPMFASYDLFNSYEERGILFNKLIEK